jgi:hypothetical protein
MTGEASGTRSGWAGVTLRVRVLLVGAVVLCVASWKWGARGKAAPTPPAAAAPPLPTRLQPEEISPADADREAPAVATAYRREIVRPLPVQSVAKAASPSDESPAAESPGGPLSRRRDEKKALPEIFRMPPDPRGDAPVARAPAPAEPALHGPPMRIDGDFAPFGRLVKCQLVDTVDSVTSRSEPIVALVTQDLDWNGNVIIPAGTEAFSYARPEPIIDAAGVGRLVDDGEWTLVMPGGGSRDNGRELILKARAVDRRELDVSPKGRARSWGIDDGSDGLVGYTLSTLDNTEIKLFAAAAVSGMVQGLGPIAERQQPAPGVSGVLGATQPAPTLGNALTASLGTGAADYLAQLASRIRDEISKRGVYVRIPAGKAFYLFVEQTIDPGAAAVGLRLPPGKGTQQ